MSRNFELPEGNNISAPINPEATKDVFRDEAYAPPQASTGELFKMPKLPVTTTEASTTESLPPLDISGQGTAFANASKESTTATGARITADSTGRTTSIRRKDGSSVTTEAERIVERGANNEVVCAWQKGLNGWVSSSNPKDVRPSMELQQNGNLKFETADGVKHTVTSQGSVFK
jgi:hypothetical protein